MITDLKKCAAALVIVSVAIVSSTASPTDVELDKENNILVVRVTEDQQPQRERQERRLDSVASPGNSPVTIEIFEEKETKNGGEIVEEIEVQGCDYLRQTSFRLLVPPIVILISHILAHESGKVWMIERIAL